MERSGRCQRLGCDSLGLSGSAEGVPLDRPLRRGSSHIRRVAHSGRAVFARGGDIVLVTRVLGRGTPYPAATAAAAEELDQVVEDYLRDWFECGSGSTVEVATPGEETVAGIAAEWRAALRTVPCVEIPETVLEGSFDFSTPRIDSAAVRSLPDRQPDSLSVPVFGAGVSWAYPEYEIINTEIDEESEADTSESQQSKMAQKAAAEALQRALDANELEGLERALALAKDAGVDRTALARK